VSIQICVTFFEDYFIYFRIIFNENGYTTEERLRFKPVIFSNTIQSMLAILRAMNRLQISFENANRQVWEISNLKFEDLMDYLGTTRLMYRIVSVYNSQ
jgi:hypothetical protein